jgi:diaminopropionate ammonia-lyase
MRYRFNPFADARVEFGATDPAVQKFHSSLPGYQTTPLHALPGLASHLGLGNLYIKDESHRFGLDAFKVLGASWAIHRMLARNDNAGPPVFACATDGSHGRAVAWAARRAGAKAVVYVPRSMPPVRMEAIRKEGAEVVVVDGLYDDAVRKADHEARLHGWQIISDNAYPGHSGEIPGWVMEGYRTLFVEADQQLAALAAAPLDLVILQAGVGAMAAAAAAHFRTRGRPHLPVLACVQPVSSDCLVESAFSENGEPCKTTGTQDSIMALLNCGMPSLLAWPVLRTSIALFLSIEDRFAEEAVRCLYHPVDGDPRILAGESGAAGLAGLIALCTAPRFSEAKEKLGISRNLSAMVIVTEGPSNPGSFNRIVSSG